MDVDMSVYEATIIPAIVFVVWVLVQVGVPKRLAPLIALLLGVVAGVLFVELSPKGFVVGILIAAASVGFNSSYKNVRQQVMKGSENK